MIESFEVTLTERDISPAPSAGRVAPTAKAKCKTVESQHRAKTPLGFTAYVWHHSVNFCYNGAKVTSWGKRYNYFTELDGLQEPRKTVVNTKTKAGSATAMSHMQREIQNCVLKYGCIQTFAPWSKITVRNDGTYAYTGGAT